VPAVKALRWAAIRQRLCDPFPVLGTFAVHCIGQRVVLSKDMSERQQERKREALQLASTSVRGDAYALLSVSPLASMADAHSENKREHTARVVL